MKKLAIVTALVVVASMAHAGIVNINALDLRSGGVFGHPDATLISGPGAVTSNQLDFVISYANLDLDDNGSANDTVNFTVRFNGPANMRAWGQGIDCGYGNLNGVTTTVINVSGTTTDYGNPIVFDGFTGGAMGVGGNGDLDRTVDINGITATVLSPTTGGFQYVIDAVDFGSPAASVVYDNPGYTTTPFGSPSARHHDLQFSAVPEPASLGLIASAAGVMLFMRRRMKK
jgi:hypothetical protein